MSYFAIVVYISLNICNAHMCALHIFSWCSCRFLVQLSIRNCTVSFASSTLTNLVMVNFPYIPCSGCEHGRWNCSLQHCPVHGGLSPWSSWSSCSLSCGGLGLKIRTRACSQPAPAHGGRDCQGPRQETTFCQAPQCPGTRTLLSGVLYIKLSLCVETIKRELISTYVVFILFAYRNN